jgi:hypothetical protein
LRRLVSSMSLPSFFRPVPMFPAPPFAPQGPVGSVPPLHRSYCGAPTSRRLDHARSRSRGRSRLVGRVAPRSPRFLGSPLCACRALRPRWSLRAEVDGSSAVHAGVAFRVEHRVGLHHTGISGLHHTAHTPAVYASQPRSPVCFLRPRKTRSRPGDPTWPDGVFTRGLLSEVLGATPPLQPGFSWRTFNTL